MKTHLPLIQKLTLLGALALFAVSTSSAAVIASYQFTTGTNIDEATAYTTAGGLTDANVTVGALIKGSGLKAASSTTGWNTTYLNTTVGAAATDLASAIAQGTYTSITIGADSGYELDLSGGSLTIDYRFIVGASGFPTNVALMFQPTGFNSTDYNIALAAPSNVVATFNFGVNAALNNLSGSKEFRIYQWSTGGTGTTNGGLSIDQGAAAGTVTGSVAGENIIFQGAVAAVPEPTTWALLAFSMTTVMVLRRRKA